MLGKLEGVFDMDVLKQQRIDYEHRFQLQSELEKLPSHFNHQIEKDQNRLSYVYNEIIFKMDTMPEFFKPALINLMGFIECAKGNGRRGERCFQNVKKMDEKNIVCLSNKAYMALKTNNYSEVEKTINEIYRQLRITNPAVLGRIRAEMGHFYQWFNLNCAARREFQRSLETDPDNLMAMYGLAVVLYDMSKHEGRVLCFEYLTHSLELFKKLLIRCPDFTLAKIYQGKAKNQLISIVLPDSKGDDEAGRIFTQVMGTDCAPEILCMIGEEYLKLGILEGEPNAISIFHRALTKRKNSKVYHLLGLAMRATYFKANPEMHEVFKQGLFLKKQQNCELDSVNVNEKSKASKRRTSKQTAKNPVSPGIADQDPLEDEFTSQRSTPTVTLDEVIATLSTAVKMSRGANREAVFDLAESLWLAGETMRAVTNFELATKSQNTLIQLKAHLRLSQAFLDANELKSTEYHLNQIMKLDTPLDADTPLANHFSKMIYDVTICFLRQNKFESAAYWVTINMKYRTDHTPILKQHMVYTRVSCCRSERNIGR